MASVRKSQLINSRTYRRSPVKANVPMAHAPAPLRATICFRVTRGARLRPPTIFLPIEQSVAPATLGFSGPKRCCGALLGIVRHVRLGRSGCAGDLSRGIPGEWTNPSQVPSRYFDAAPVWLSQPGAVAARVTTELDGEHRFYCVARDPAQFVTILTELLNCGHKAWPEHFSASSRPDDGNMTLRHGELPPEGLEFVMPGTPLPKGAVKLKTEKGPARARYKAPRHGRG